jgi:gas vesicle protein
MKPLIALALTLAVTTANAQQWSDLAPSSREVLKPLRATWDDLPAAHQQQWLKKSSALQQLSNEQLKVAQERMAEWASLSEKQRTQVQSQINNTNNDADSRAKSWSGFLNQK